MSASRQRTFCAARAIGLLLALATVASGQFNAHDGPATYDSHPSMARHGDADTWVAWHAYSSGNDRILARRLAADGALGDVETISQRGEVHGPPTMLAGPGDTAWVVWTAQQDGHWNIVARHFRDGNWRPAVAISDPAGDAIQPAAEWTARGGLLVAWSRLHNGRFQIECRRFDGDAWGQIRSVSADGPNAHRPALATGDGGQAWIFWDQYEDGMYGVAGRKLLPEMGEIERLSPAGQHCLTPTALMAGDRLFVAWLRKQDVIGGPGVISQLHTLQVATREKGRWNAIADRQGSTIAAELTHGLMAKIDPRPVATGGYLGRRAAPMLLANGPDVWLLWERKSDHTGSTASVAGDLIGRRIHDSKLQAPAVLHQGMLDYHLAHPARGQEGNFIAVASRPPRSGQRPYRRVEVNLAGGKPFQQEAWTGWRPVELPIENELAPRRTIQHGETTYHLYWADLHCHSNLSADAEGETDELTHYARDRAGLDVVLFSENDYYLVPLTQYEYELGNFLARACTQPGQFLSLSGYEWTSRIPRAPDAKLADPGNWTPPYRNRSIPNHRTVLYPAAGGPLVRFPEAGNDIGRLNEAVRRAGGVTLTQHEVFEASEHSVEVAMEVTAGWRRYIESHTRSFHDPLNAGMRLGFVANGDSHRRALGLSGALTAIYARELTIDAILDALRARRCYATNGAQIFVDARANDVLLGEEIIVRDRRVKLTLRAIGTRPIVSATLLGDGKEIKTFAGDGGREMDITLTEADLPSGTHWYYWRIAQERSAPVLPGNLMAAHGHLAWSTPHWVVVP